jgi:hypothetical protein
MYLRTCGSFKSAKTANYQKRLGLQIENPQNATFKAHKFADLRFAELIFGPTTFMLIFSIKRMSSLCRVDQILKIAHNQKRLGPQIENTRNANCESPQI